MNQRRELLIIPVAVHTEGRGVRRGASHSKEETETVLFRRPIKTQSSYTRAPCKTAGTKHVSHIP